MKRFNLAWTFLIPLCLWCFVAVGCSPEVRGGEVSAAGSQPGAGRESDQRPPVVLGADVSAPISPPTVILISLDGTRPADLTPEATPTLLRLAAGGAIAEGLIPVSPSNTFPSHVSLVTGVHPEEHRLVNNRFIDPLRGEFKRKAPHEWIESEPIWSIAEREGRATASYHWVGSEGPWAGGPGPRHTRKFSSRTLEKTKVNRILNWLGLPDPAERPVLITSWFHGADHAGHVSGPGTPAVAKGLAPQDAQIARLVSELEARDLLESTTLIFVSDHGMSTAERKVNLGLVLSRAGLSLSTIGIGGFSTLVFDEGQRTEASQRRAVEVARSKGLEAYVRSEAPADWHVDDARFGDVVVRAPVGVAIVAPSTQIPGFHGYAPENPEMAGILIAYGRGVTPGSKLGKISSLSVAPTVLRLLGLPVPPQMKATPVRALTAEISGT
ncbi:MAG: alkaline phosphatase family protein [Myxococcota bacterium]